MSNSVSQSDSTIMSEVANYIASAHNDDFDLFDVELVSNRLLNMRKNKAAGVDGIQTEHLLFAHLLVTAKLCCLFTFIIPTFPNGNITETVLQVSKCYLFIVVR